MMIVDGEFIHARRITYIRVYVNICIGELRESFEYVLDVGEPW